MSDFIKGIDISRWQGTNIKWNDIKRAGYEFVFIKVTDGSAYKQAFINGARVQANGALKAGLKIGYYHFAHPANSPTVQSDARMEADYFINTLNTGFQNPHFPLALDFEDDHMLLSPADAVSWITAFANKIKEVYPELIFYTYKGYTSSHLTSDHSLNVLPLWIASYPRKINFRKSPSIPRNWTTWQIWQYSNKGVVPGIATVNLNVMKKSFFEKY